MFWLDYVFFSCDHNWIIFHLKIYEFSIQIVILMQNGLFLFFIKKGLTIIEFYFLFQSDLSASIFIFKLNLVFQIWLFLLFKKAIAWLGYSGHLEFFTQGVTGVPCSPFCASMSAPWRFGPWSSFGFSRLCLCGDGVGMM